MDRESPGPGIRWDASRQQWRAFVEVGSGAGRTAGRLTTSRRFPEGTPLREMREWQERARVALRLQRDAGPVAGLTPATAPEADPTLAQAADAYLETVTAMPSYASRRHDLLAWVRALGDTRVDALTARDLLLVWNGWRAGKVAASTLQHRRTALLQCLTLMAPAVAALAKATLPRPASARSLPRELPYPTIRLIVAAAGETRAGTMLAVMAETGLPPETLRRLTARDVDLRAASVRLPARRKGGTAAPVTLPLTPMACEAFRRFFAAGGQGGVAKATLYTVWQRGCAAVRASGVDVPPCSPYILRHSFAGRVLDARPGDLQALQFLLQHEDLETSMGYVRARVGRSTAAAIEALAELQRQPDPSRESIPPTKTE